MKICIDAGHGGSDAGAVNGKRYEKNDNLEMALKLQRLLKEQGITVVMTRETDKDVSLAQRTSLANKEKCDYFLSLHRDSFKDAYGATVYVYSSASTKTYNYGKAILDAVVNSGGFSSRGVRKGAPNYKDFAVNKDTTMPACLLELGFISSALDNSNFDRKKDAIAIAIAKALCKQLGITYKDKTVAKKTNTEIAKEVIQGKWGNGQDRINRLKKAGYNPTEIQKIVNSLIAKPTTQPTKKTSTEIAKEVIQGKWGNGQDRINRLKKAGYNPTEIQKVVNKLLR